MREIPLTRGKFAIVDDEDYEYLSKSEWQYGTYAMRSVPKEGGGQRVERMHRVIMNAPKGMEIDHINHNKLDNRKCNLRLCTSSQNSRNLPIRKNTKSGYKGVSWHKQMNKWRVQIVAKGKVYYLGLFDDKHEAAVAYNEKAAELSGEFAYLNEINAKKE